MTVATVQYNDNLLTHSVLALLQYMSGTFENYSHSRNRVTNIHRITLPWTHQWCFGADKITNKRHLKNMMGKVKMLK